MAHLLGGLIAGLVMATDAPASDGAAIYRSRCLSCHQADGRGVPFFQPSVVDSRWLTGSPEDLARLILFGGEWGGYENAMPGADDLADRDIAALMTYLRRRFTDTAFSPVPVEKVAEARARGPYAAP